MKEAKEAHGDNLPFRNVKIGAEEGRLGLTIENARTNKAILGFVDQDGDFTQIAKINADELRDAADIFLELADTLESRDESDEEEEDEDEEP
jgi:hypothetical protein